MVPVRRGGPGPLRGARAARAVRRGAAHRQAVRARGERARGRRSQAHRRAQPGGDDEVAPRSGRVGVGGRARAPDRSRRRRGRAALDRAPQGRAEGRRRDRPERGLPLARGEAPRSDPDPPVLPDDGRRGQAQRQDLGTFLVLKAAGQEHVLDAHLRPPRSRSCSALGRIRA